MSDIFTGNVLSINTYRIQIGEEPYISKVTWKISSGEKYVMNCLWCILKSHFNVIHVKKFLMKIEIKHLTI